MQTTTPQEPAQKKTKKSRFWKIFAGEFMVDKDVKSTYPYIGFVVLLFVLLSFAASWAASRLPWISGLSGGTRVILLTVVLSAIAAAAFPAAEEEEETAHEA